MLVTKDQATEIFSRNHEIISKTLAATQNSSEIISPCLITFEPTKDDEMIPSGVYLVGDMFRPEVPRTVVMKLINELIENNHVVLLISESVKAIYKTLAEHEAANKKYGQSLANHPNHEDIVMFALYDESHKPLIRFAKIDSNRRLLPMDTPDMDMNLASGDLVPKPSSPKPTIH